MIARAKIFLYGYRADQFVMEKLSCDCLESALLSAVSLPFEFIKADVHIASLKLRSVLSFDCRCFKTSKFHLERKETGSIASSAPSN